MGPHIGDAEATWHVGFRLKASHDWTRLVVGFCDNTSSEYNSYGFVPMDTLELMQPGTWTEHHYTWTRPAGKSRLAFRMIRDMQDGDMRTVYIDDVRIEKCGIYNLRNYRTDAWDLRRMDNVRHAVNAAGCDSTVTYTLHVYRNYADTLHVNRCDNQVPYTWHSHTLAADTTLSDTLASVHGADSVTTLVLAVHPTYDLADTIVVCPGSGFIYEGVDYGGPTEFDSPHLTIHDCDSMVHVVLRPRDGSVRLAPVVSLDGSPWMTYDTTLLDCRPSELRLLDTAASVSRQWTFWPADGLGDTLSSTDSLLTASFDTTGIFSFQLIAVDSNLCNDTIRRDSALWVFPPRGILHLVA
ncbi:MAG: hypothetical protein IKN29_04560 [Bacteroidales bacterium]|nr:hypothetical protein [Bacteroidales bacterium]